MGNTGEELVPAGEVAFAVLCGDNGQPTQCHVLMHGKCKNYWQLKGALSPSELVLRHNPSLSPANTHKQGFQRTTSTHFVCLHDTDARNKRTSTSHFKFMLPGESAHKRHQHLLESELHMPAHFHRHPSKERKKRTFPPFSG